jgi:hypothetical protein
VSVLQTILVFVVPTVGIFLLVVALVVVPRRTARPRYRSGQPWPYKPL